MIIKNDYLSLKINNKLICLLIPKNIGFIIKNVELIKKHKGKINNNYK
jgi:hypothetical protein